MKAVCDHKGNKFKSVTDLCMFYKITLGCYRYGMEKGIPLEQILEPRPKIVDKYGNKFKFIEEFCLHYNISRRKYNYYINVKKLSLDELVDIIENNFPNKHLPKHNRFYLEFEGKAYTSIREVCETFGIKKDTYYHRKYRGFTVEECLRGKKKKEKPDKHRYSYDHLGNKFKTQKEMCDYYNVKLSTYRRRLRKGKTKEEALRPAVRGRCYPYLYDGHYFVSLKELCKYYAISYDTFRHYKTVKGWSTEESLQKCFEIKQDKSEILNAKNRILDENQRN